MRRVPGLLIILWVAMTGCTISAPIGSFDLLYQPELGVTGIQLEGGSEPVLDEDCIHHYYIFPDKAGYDIEELIRRACEHGAVVEAKLEQVIDEYFFYRKTCLVLTGLCVRVVQ